MFADRDEAGWLLGKRLVHLRGEDVVVLALPRGGVPVAYEVARALDAPLDVLVVRPLGAPFRPEVAFGAIGEGGVRVLDDEAVRDAGVTAEEVAAVSAHEAAAVERRARPYRPGHPQADLAGRVALIVDDGVTTGLTARAACRVARARGAARVVLAVPVAPPAWQAAVGADADELYSLVTPKWFFAVSQFYEDFSAVPDGEIVARLERAGRRLPRPGRSRGAAPATRGAVA